MVQVIEQTDRFGKIGKAFGQGLGEQIPKEVERYQLNKGLEKFEQEAKGKTPFQQAVDFYKIRGTTPEMAQNLFPLLRQQQQREEALNIKPPQPKGNEASKEINREVSQEMPIQGESTGEGLKRSLKSPETTRAQYTPFIAPSQEERMGMAADLSRENPVTYPTPQDALQRINEDVAIQEKNFREQQAVGNAADALTSRLRSGLETHWGKELMTKGIPGTIQTRLLSNAEADLADPKNKLSERQIIQKWGDVGKNIAQQNTNLENLGFFQKWTDDKKSIHDKIDSARRAYEEVGALEEFSDFLSSQFNFSSDLSSKLSYKNRPEVEKVFKDFKPAPTLTDEDWQNKLEQEPIRMARELAPKLKSDDSLLSLAYHVRKLGYDPQIFLKEMKKLSDNRRIPESKFHDREFTKGVPVTRSLYDIYFSDMAGIQ